MHEPDVDRRLIDAAKAARISAYAPYSKFEVGAALLGEDGTIYGGCNVENAVYPVGVCAERTALGHAILHGQRRFKAIAVVADAAEVCVPCGMCRQALAEFGKEIRVIMANLRGDVSVMALQELLPRAFGESFLDHSRRKMP